MFRAPSASKLAFTALALASCLRAAAADYPAPRASADATLGAGSLLMRLSLEGGASRLGFGLEAGEGGMGLAGALSLASTETGRPRMIAGPGSIAGPARLLVDPTSPTPLGLGSPVELDASLASRSSVLGLDAGPASLFALAEGRGLERRPHAAALGLCLTYAGSEGALSGVAAASYDGPRQEASGWRPEPSTSPALAPYDEGRPVAGFALLAERRGASGSAIAALSATYGRLAGPGMALRLEARERAGPLGLRLSAAAAGSAFRRLMGPRQDRLLEGSVEARLAFRRASSITVNMETQALRETLLYSPRWGRKASLRLILPLLGVERVFETRLEAASPGWGEGGGTWTCALVRRARDGSGSLRLGSALRWEGAFSGAKLALESLLAGEGGLPRLRLELSLDILDEGRADSPVAAKGALSLALPFGEGASLELEAALPEEGLALSPAAEGGSSPLAFGLRYRVSSPLDRAQSSGRPRSRSQRQYKALRMR